MTGVCNHPKSKYENLAVFTQPGSDYELLDLEELIQKLSSSEVYVSKTPRDESAETKEQTNSATNSEIHGQHGRGRGSSQGRGHGGDRGAY